jgi:catechol 2,3-dioxygenase-like lactoylglutathione lyase family enzyme
MENVKVPDSAPVSVVVIGAEDFDASLQFYSNTLGLEVIEQLTCQGPEFEQHWNLPAGSAAKCAILGHGADPIGRIQIMEFNATDRKRVRPDELQRAHGLVNLNIYSSDIYADFEKLQKQGFSFWSKPTQTDFGPAVGEICEVMCDGPDGIVINLVQLITEDPNTLSGKILNFIADYGRTRTGFTAVATTACGVEDMDKALEFYYGPLKMTLFMDTVLEGAAYNKAIGLPEHAQTHSVFTQGGHEYGKIALSCPMNYELPTLVPNAVAPNIGYLAQSFQVNDLEQTAGECREMNVEVVSEPKEITLPGRGPCRAMLVRNPGSGALQEIFQQIR